jgi:hypothetical protein
VGIDDWGDCCSIPRALEWMVLERVRGDGQGQAAGGVFVELWECQFFIIQCVHRANKPSSMPNPDLNIGTNEIVDGVTIVVSQS